MTTKPDGEVVIKAGGKAVAGWTEVSISGGLDMMPSVFELSMTEHYPGMANDIVLNPGDACTIEIGGDLVLTGWINRYTADVEATQHHVRVSGRSRCQDLVDCSALPKNLTINGASIGKVATELAAPFAGPITVQLPDGDGNGRDFVVSVSWGETPWEIISEIASYEGLLVHDDARGDLVICKVGTKQTASGFREGSNVQGFGVSASDDMLYSIYIPALMAQDSLANIGTGQSNHAGANVPDPLVKRYRPLVVVSNQMVQGEFLAQLRAVWEATRRRGRSRQVSVTADSWRDSAGTLWTHNVLAALDLPTVHLTGVKWIIASWNFVRDGHRGTVCHLTLMPPEAFAVQPSALNSLSSQVAQASAGAAAERARAAPALGTPDGPHDGRAITAPNANRIAAPAPDGGGMGQGGSNDEGHGTARGYGL